MGGDFFLHLENTVKFSSAAFSPSIGRSRLASPERGTLGRPPCFLGHAPEGVHARIYQTFRRRLNEGKEWAGTGPPPLRHR